MSIFSLIYGITTSLIGFILNGIMLYCVIRTQQRSIGIISNLFVFLGIVNIISLFSFMGLSPVIFCLEGRTLYVSEGYAANTPFAGLFFHVFYGTLATVFGSMAQCFFYRYLILCKPNVYAWIVTKTGKLVNISVFVFFIAHFAWSCWFSLQPSEESEAFFEKFDRFKHFDFEKIQYRTISLTDLTTNAPRFIAFLTLLVNNMLMFSVITFCAVNIYFKLHSHRYQSTQLAPNAKSHEKVFRLLLIQTIIPVISFMAPLSLLIVYVIFEMESGIIVNTLIASAYPFFGLCYPLSTLLLVNTYSNYMKTRVFKSVASSIKVSTIAEMPTLKS